MTARRGPLAGYRVVEIAGLGAAPFCAMMLTDMGADVLLVERAPARPPPYDAARNLLNRGRPCLTLDLKDPVQLEAVLHLAGTADVLLEGFRPGVMERLGLGPSVCLHRNPRLIYARLTGWGQTGPMAPRAGHDINYFALSGGLALCGRPGEAPNPNLNLVADMGGGGMMLAFGIACALSETARSGQGQVIDAAMVDGAALLAMQIHSLRAMGLWTDSRAANLLDGGAPFYTVYETADDRYMAVGAIEPAFYANLLKGLDLDAAGLPAQHDQDGWPALRGLFAERFLARTREAWSALFEPLDACVTPVLDPNEAAQHPHLAARASFSERAGLTQPMPAPRFSRTPGDVADTPPGQEISLATAFANWGLEG